MKHSTLFVVAALSVVVAACQQTPKDGLPGASANRAAPVDEHANPPFKNVHQMMRAKLAHAQAVLEGIATGDMKQVAANADALHELSKLSDWQVHRTMEYNLYSEDFRWNVQELGRHAREKKLHAATLDYMAMTMTCVKCHDYMAQAGLVHIDQSEQFRSAARMLTGVERQR